MIKKLLCTAFSVVILASILCGCEIDVNKLSKVESGGSSATASDSAVVQAAVSEADVSSDSETAVSEPESDTESDTDSEPWFDTSAYKTLYVTGARSITVTSDAKENSASVGTLSYGESVSLIKTVSVNTTRFETSFIYSQTLDAFGYIKSINLVELSDEVTYGDIYTVKNSKSPFYSDDSKMAIISYLSKNDKVTVLAKLSDGNWRVSDKSGNVGYIDKELITDKSTASSSSVSSKSTSSTVSVPVESKYESKLESEYESRNESEYESKNESLAVSSNYPSVMIGEGAAPESGYTVYVVDVDLGYLALRDKPSAEESTAIGEMYYGEQVYVIDSSGEFWYVYAPDLGKYGYVSGISGYMYPLSDYSSYYYDE